jgi:hypothetical protein
VLDFYTDADERRKNSRAATQPGLIWWTRLQPIRTVVEIPLECAVLTGEPFAFQRIAGEARRMRALGMTLQAIGAAFGVDEKTVRKALARSAS